MHAHSKHAFFSSHAGYWLLSKLKSSKACTPLLLFIAPSTWLLSSMWYIVPYVLASCGVAYVTVDMGAARAPALRRCPSLRQKLVPNIWQHIRLKSVGFVRTSHHNSHAQDCCDMLSTGLV